MPIKGLTDQSNPGAGLPLVARLYKGDEKPEDGRRPGADLKYFRVEFEPHFESLRPIWEGMYGTEPAEFENVYLTAQTTDEAFSTWREQWNARQTLLHRCDGEYQAQWFDESINKVSRAKVLCAAPQCQCKQVGRLNLLLPDFVDATGVLGYVLVTTHSVNDILTVYRYLMDIERLHGSLLNVPFVFGRSERAVNVPRTQDGKEGRIKTSKSLFYIRVTSEFTQAHLLRDITHVPALPAPPVIPIDEAKRMLGSGKARRLVVQPETANGVFSDSAKKAQLLDYAAKHFKYDAEDVVFALNETSDTPIESVEDWTGSVIEAIGALIATYCGYDADEVERLTSNNKYKVEHYDAAITAVKRWAEVHEIVEAEGA